MPTATPPTAVRRPAPKLPAPGLPAPELLVTVVAVAVVSWRVGVPGPWRDEGATRLAAGRPLPDLLALTGTVDLVHLPYYLVAHAVLAAHDSITALRWLSVAAMALTAGVLVAIGRRLGSVPAGVVAGLALAVSPLASRYGQEARPYAVAALAASLAALVLVRASEPGAQRWAWRRAWAGYALAVVVMGLVNVLALFVLAGHAVFVLLSRRGAWRAWTLTTAAALALLAPFLVATSRQGGQVGWLVRPGGRELADVLAAPFDSLALPAAMLALAVLLAAAAGPSWAGRPILALGLGWGLLPPVLLWLVSQWHPLFDGRYAVAALPGACLAVASSTLRDHARRADFGATIVAVVAVVAVLAVVGWPAQVRYRDPGSGHGEDVLGADRILTAEARPGDAVLFVPYHLRIVQLMRPGSPQAPPDDVALGAGPLASATLSGTDVPPSELGARLAGRERIWLVTGPAGTSAATTPSDLAKVALLARDYVEVSRRQITHFTVTLYQHPRRDQAIRGPAADRRPSHEEPRIA